MSQRNTRGREDELYAFLVRYFAEKKRSPSIREIADGMGWKSTSTANYWLARLERYDKIEREPNISRSILLK